MRTKQQNYKDRYYAMMHMLDKALIKLGSAKLAWQAEYYNPLELTRLSCDLGVCRVITDLKYEDLPTDIRLRDWIDAAYFIENCVTVARTQSRETLVQFAKRELPKVDTHAQCWLIHCPHTLYEAFWTGDIKQDTYIEYTKRVMKFRLTFLRKLLQEFQQLKPGPWLDEFN